MGNVAVQITDELVQLVPTRVRVESESNLDPYMYY